LTTVAVGDSQLVVGKGLLELGAPVLERFPFGAGLLEHVLPVGLVLAEFRLALAQFPVLNDLGLLDQLEQFVD
jgi:hypothetical protein